MRRDVAISFVIPAFNEAALIGACTASIQAEIARAGVEAEIIVVDNGSSDRTAQIAAGMGATVVFEPKKGITHARQAGMYAARHEIHAYIDADNILPSGWIDNVIALADSFGVVAVSGPLRLTGQGPGMQALGRAFYALNRVAHRWIGASLQGGNYAVKAWALRAAGGHSTDIAFYGEDTDLARRLAHFGQIKLRPSMWVHSSARRFEGQGVLKTALIYAANYFSVHLLRRPVTLTHQDFRPD